jgi:hypothetical protein
MLNFTVFVFDRYNQVTTLCRFSNKVVPSTRQEFWLATGVDDRISKNYGAARVTVSMKEGLSKLDANSKSTDKYKIDEKYGVMFQLCPFHTPTRSPSEGAEKDEGVEKVQSHFRSVMEELFKPNPFASGIPAVYEDPTIRELRAFFQRSSQQDTTDSCVLALILAMPGSGKTRTVAETAMKETYNRFRMSNQTFESAASVQKFLEESVKKSCRGVDEIPLKYDDVVVVHFDEIQSLMEPPKGSEEPLVTTLSKAIDAMVNVHPPRSWLKFVMTGTNIFTRTTIKIGSDVKAMPIPLDGSFSLEFVTKLAHDHGLSAVFQDTNYLERCRHNRRFTEYFFFNVWNEFEKDNFAVAKAYEMAFIRMKEQMNNQIKLLAPVSKVACTVFAKLLAVAPEDIVEGVVFLRKCSREEKAYIAGGGLNVRDIEEDGINIFYPAGFVLEVLEALLGRAASYKSGNTVTAFLRVHRVTGFGVKGHLLEWLIAHDISCVRSEFNTVMAPSATRHDSCIGAEAISDAQAYHCIMKEGTEPGIWVVRDTHNSKQNRWVDVAYSIVVPSDSYRAGFVLLECKTGYKNQSRELNAFCDKFFQEAATYAQMYPDYYFVATFVCEFEFARQEALSIFLPSNMVTAVQAIRNTCPSISKFLAADPTDDDNTDALVHEVVHAVASSEGAKCYGGGSQPE